MGNYDGSHIDTGFFFEGYVDNYNCTSKELGGPGGDTIIQNRQWSRYDIS